MTNTAVEISLQGHGAIIQRLELLRDMDITPLRHQIGALVESQTRDRIHTQKQSPDGKKWLEWGANWAASRHKGHGLLENEGDLLNSVHFLVQGGDILVGSDLVYAAIHHFGGAEVGIGIPARPYLGMGPVDWEEAIDLTDAFVARVLH
jgi:phage virion morphogenesis protein